MITIHKMAYQGQANLMVSLHILLQARKHELMAAYNILQTLAARYTGAILLLLQMDLVASLVEPCQTIKHLLQEINIIF